MAKSTITTVKTLHGSIADLADPRIPVPQRVRLFFQAFARKGDRTIRVSRTFLALTLLNDGSTAGVDKIKKAEKPLENDGIIEVAVRPPSGRCREEFVLTYRYIDNPNKCVDAVPDHVLAGLNKFSKHYRYVRPAEYVYAERPAPGTEKPATGKALNIPDLWIPRHFVRHPCFQEMFEPTEMARKSWHTINSFITPAGLQLLVLGCSEYFLGRKEWANKPIEQPGRILCSMTKRVADAIREGTAWEEKFPPKFQAILKAVGPRMGTFDKDPSNLRLRDLIISGST